MPFEDVETLLLDPEIGKNLKAIFLFRDPRARLQSLKSKVHWCNKNETINLCNPSNLCRFQKYFRTGIGFVNLIDKNHI